MAFPETRTVVEFVEYHSAEKGASLIFPNAVVINGVPVMVEAGSVDVDQGTATHPARVTLTLFPDEIRILTRSVE